MDVGHRAGFRRRRRPQVPAAVVGQRGRVQPAQVVVLRGVRVPLLERLELAAAVL